MAIWTDLTDLIKNQKISRTIINGVLENQRFLRDKPRYFYQRDYGDADYTTASTSFATVDATNMSTTLTTYGNDIRVRWSGVFDQTSGTNNILWEVVIDGVPLSNDVVNGLGGITDPNTDGVIRLFWEVIIPNIAAGSHTITLQWKVSAGTATWQVANMIQFEVEEI